MRTPYDWTRTPDPDAPPSPPSHPIFKWVIIAINVAFLAWIISAANAAGTSSTCDGLTGDLLTACQNGEAVGTGIAIFGLVAFWAFVDVILGVLYLVTRKR
jgi:hypothetical protein